MSLFHIIKSSGDSAWNSRAQKMHGSRVEWGRNVSQGKLQRQNEKPSILQWGKGNANRHPR